MACGAEEAGSGRDFAPEELSENWLQKFEGG